MRITRPQFASLLVRLTAILLAALPICCTKSPPPPPPPTPETRPDTTPVPAPNQSAPNLRVIHDLDLIRPLLIRALRPENITDLLQASTQSANFLAQPYSPSPRFTTHSLETFQQILRSADLPEEKAGALLEAFTIYESVGFDNRGTVQFTGYFAPEYAASGTPTDRFRYPVYRAPPDFLKAVRTQAKAPPTYSPRRVIEEDHLLDGLEIAYLANPLDLYLLHVNGSGLLRLPDQTTLALGYSTTNNLPYTSLGKLLIAGGYARPDEMSMQTIRAIFSDHPAVVLDLMAQNDRYVFFEELPADSWPRGALGSVLTPLRSIATDKEIFPPGGVVLVTTSLPTVQSGNVGEDQSFVQLMFDQDTGGAIKGPGRADLFIGSGDTAGQIAGRLNAIGQLYYLLPKTNTDH